MARDINFESVLKLRLPRCWHFDDTVTWLQYNRLLPDVKDLHSIVSHKSSSKHCHLQLVLSCRCKEAWDCYWWS